MTSHCVITRQDPTPTEEGGRRTWRTTVVYEGPCKVQTYEAYETAAEAGGHTYITQRYRLDIPARAPALAVGDVAKVNSFPRPFRVAGELDKTHLTAQRVPVEIMAR